MVYARDKERLRRVAERQYGRVTGAQLAHLGLWRSTIKSWIQTGYLVPVLPKVYAVGHIAPSHSSRAQLHRDRENDLTLRRRGVTVHRYVWEQLREQGPRIRDEILAELS